MRSRSRAPYGDSNGRGSSSQGPVDRAYERCSSFSDSEHFYFRFMYQAHVGYEIDVRFPYAPCGKLLSTPCRFTTVENIPKFPLEMLEVVVGHVAEGAK